VQLMMRTSRINTQQLRESAARAALWKPNCIYYLNSIQ
jgi:hypothetical protein